jgi:hypothetical protein
MENNATGIGFMSKLIHRPRLLAARFIHIFVHEMRS